MTKKFLAVFLLSFTLLIVGQSSNAEAEVYVGNYGDGTPVYLQSVNIESRNPYRFSCRVRAGYDHLNYYFYPYNGSPYYRNNEGYEGYVFGGSSPVAASIYRYVVNNY